MKRISLILTLFIFCVCTQHISAQFITKGLIEYERKTNQHALMDENSIWDAAAKKALPQFITSYYELRFDQGHSFYKLGREPEVRQNKYYGIFDAENSVATDLDSNKSVTAKDMQGATYLIANNIRKVDWKIGSETRTIAGFECRKAVGKILDSVVVIAFYCEEIIPSGGPESFAGLPGMILGIAIPRLHTTWYATKLQLVNVSSNELAVPKKGKKIEMEEFKKQMQSTFASEGGTANLRQLLMIL